MNLEILPEGSSLTPSPSLNMLPRFLIERAQSWWWSEGLALSLGWLTTQSLSMESRTSLHLSAVRAGSALKEALGSGSMTPPLIPIWVPGFFFLFAVARADTRHPSGASGNPVCTPFPPAESFGCFWALAIFRHHELTAQMWGIAAPTAAKPCWPAGDPGVFTLLELSPGGRFQSPSALGLMSSHSLTSAHGKGGESGGPKPSLFLKSHHSSPCPSLENILWA